MPHAYPFVSPVSHPGLAAAYVAEREASNPPPAAGDTWDLPFFNARPVRLAEQTPGGMWRVHGHDRLLTADVFTHPKARRLPTSRDQFIRNARATALATESFQQAVGDVVWTLRLSRAGVWILGQGGIDLWACDSLDAAVEALADMMPVHAQPSATRNEHVHVVVARRQLSTLGGNPLYCVSSIPGRTVKIERRQSEYVVSYVTDTAGGLDVRKADLESALRVFGDFLAHGETVRAKAAPRTYTTAGLTLTEAERQMVGRAMHFQPVAPEAPRGTTEDQRRVWLLLMAAHGVKLGCAVSRATRARIAADLGLTEPPLPSWVVPGLLLRAPVAALPEREWVTIRAVLPDAVVLGPAHNPMMPADDPMPSGIFLAQYGGQGPAVPAPRAGRVLANLGGIPTPEPVCSDDEREETALLDRRGLDLGVPRLVKESGHPEANLDYKVRLDVAEILAAWARAKRRVQDAIKADHGPFARAREVAMVTWFEHMRTQDANAAALVNAEDMRVFLITYERLRGARTRPAEEAQKFGSLAPACVITTYERARSL